MQLTKNQMVAALGALAIVIGSFMDWAKVQTILGSLSVSGFDAGDGKLTAAIGGVALLLFVFAANRSKAIVAAILGAAAFGIGLYDYNNLTKKLGDVNDSDFARASVGIGLYLVIGGGALAFGAGLAWRKEAPRGAKPLSDQSTSLHGFQRDDPQTDASAPQPLGGELPPPFTPPTA